MQTRFIPPLHLHKMILVSRWLENINAMLKYTCRMLVVANILEKATNQKKTHTDALGFTLFPSVVSRD